MKKSIVALGMVLALSGCAAAADETLAAEPAALVEISPATEENAQPVEAAATADPVQTATPAPTPEPTQAPTPAPTAEPTAVPTAEPTQAPVEETVAATPAQVSMSYGAVPFDLAAGTEHLLELQDVPNKPTERFSWRRTFREIDERFRQEGEQLSFYEER